MLGITLDKTVSNDIYTKKLIKNLNRLVNSLERQQANVIVDIFHEIDDWNSILILKKRKMFTLTKFICGL